ncbi:hypothetical protein BpHYR1_008474 [Brachionus plicatilis]|uniref:Uncharacterized protein n=1 Tax=Brachionus plicatilis TaxID=10195 RepID=A0A3M7SA31_BRAPC|nr:hypothetical protein BpHYR1_008474 [Brachionus plicatilis]
MKIEIIKLNLLILRTISNLRSEECSMVTEECLTKFKAYYSHTRPLSYTISKFFWLHTQDKV